VERVSDGERIAEAVSSRTRNASEGKTEDPDKNGTEDERSQ
jgi:hypothetical protein